MFAKRLDTRDERPYRKRRRADLQRRRQRGICSARHDHRPADIIRVKRAAYTLDVSKLPGGRGHGDPVRLLLDIEPAEEIVEIFVHDPARKLLVASRIANGFIVPETELVSTRKAGKQILNVRAPDEAAACVPVIGDHVAVLGENRKLLCFALADIPEMPRGKGVRLQRHGDGHLLIFVVMRPRRA